MFTEPKSESVRRDRESMKTEAQQTGNYQPLLVPNKILPISFCLLPRTVCALSLIFTILQMS